MVSEQILLGTFVYRTESGVAGKIFGMSDQSGSAGRAG